jgi:hypothetical protein
MGRGTPNIQRRIPRPMIYVLILMVVFVIAFRLQFVAGYWQ